MDDHFICRLMLKEAMENVRKLTTVEERKGCYAHRIWLGSSFYGPGNFVWEGNACCKWLARAEGWAAWLEEQKDNQ